MRNIVLEKDNGKVIDLPKTKEVIYELHEGSRIKHLCFDCVRGCVSKCAKVADYRKKPITAYDFIIGGYQIYDNKGDVQEFTVTECQNYKYDEPKYVSKKEKMAARKVIGLFHMAYFGANDLDELEEIKDDLGLIDKIEETKKRVKVK